ncbi:hypothetical protein HDU85_002884 [Gaertneriomyces sp. JEL0708]|nr:hypothetical protein HDU85_002884 [Gaertneriomyces sp. JEL0708]
MKDGSMRTYRTYQQERVEHRKRKENCSFFKGTGKTTKVRKRVVNKTRTKATESQRAASPVASEAESVVPSEADLEPDIARGIEETQQSTVDEEVEVEKTRADAPIRKYRRKRKPDDEADVSEVSDKENNVRRSISEKEVADPEKAPAPVNEPFGASRRARGKQEKVQTRHESPPANVVESTEEFKEGNTSVMQEDVAVRRPRREKARAVNYAEDDFDLDGKPKKSRRNSTELRQRPNALEPEVTASIRQTNDVTAMKKAGLKASTARSFRVEVPKKRSEQSKSDASSQGVAVDESFGSEVGESEIDSMSITNDMEGDDVDPALGPDQMEIDIPEEETVNASVPLAIRGMPNLPKFCEHINVPPISPETLVGATANLTEDERKMTVEEYLRAQAQTACDELVRRRLQGWRQVDDEFNKLRMWIETLPET